MNEVKIIIVENPERIENKINDFLFGREFYSVNISVCDSKYGFIVCINYIAKPTDEQQLKQV